MPCFPRRHHHFQHHRFHPYVRMQHPFFFDAEAEVPTFLQGKGKMTEESRSSSNREISSEDTEAMDFVIRMEVPGVEASHITMEEKNGELEIVAIRMDTTQQSVTKTYQDVFYLHPSKADLSQLSATLTDGILTIRVPKTAPNVVKVTAETSAPPPASTAPSSTMDSEDAMKEDTDDTKNVETRFCMDLPGVSSGDVFIRIDDDHVLVKAIRRNVQGGCRGNGLKFVQVFDLPVSADKTRAKAYLHNGVLTVVVPPHAPPAEADESNGLRTFYVIPVSAKESIRSTPQENEDSVSLPGVASLRLNEDEAAEPMVETVQEWERVEAASADEDQKPAAK